MSRCKSCDVKLKYVDYAIKPRELQEDIPEELEEELCVSCVGLAFFPYVYSVDHRFVLEDAKDGLTEPLFWDL